jgi:hypothetical protein
MNTLSSFLAGMFAGLVAAAATGGLYLLYDAQRRALEG